MSAKTTAATASSSTSKDNSLKDISRETVESIARRAHYLATQMIYQANHRTDKEKGDPNKDQVRF